MIRFAKEADIDRIMAFIDTYWKKGHILGTNREFFKYEHLLDEGVTYVISENDSGTIEAILGYIPYAKQHRDVMTVMWKANHTAEPFLGIKLFNFLKANGDVRIMASPGSNPNLKRFYDSLRYPFGKMNHWYRLNRKKDVFCLAKVEDQSVPETYGDVRFKLYSTWNELDQGFDWIGYQNSNPKPYKEKWYIEKRYFNHPIYKYKAYGLTEGDGPAKLLMIVRKAEANDSYALRLVDLIGNIELISSASNLLDTLLLENDAEYIDCYEVGVNAETMLSAGFTKTENTKNIIPNYFAPFVQENIDIYYFSSDPETVLFKGDGDQDRPN